MAYFYYATKRALIRQMNSTSTARRTHRSEGCLLLEACPALLCDFQDSCSANGILNANRPAVSAIWHVSMLRMVC